MKTELIFKLSAIIDKMDIADQIAKLDITTAKEGDVEGEKKDKKELGAKIVMIFISKIHKAKDEVCDLISYYKGITLEEAKEADIIPIIQEIFNNMDGIQDFLA